MTSLTGVSAESLERIRERFVENMWKGVLGVVLLGTPVSLSRAVFTGWQPIYTLHLLVAACSLAIFVFLKRIPLQARALWLLVLFWALGLPGLFTLGFPATSVWWLVLSCMVAGTMYPIRVGVALGLATLAVVALAGIGFTTGRLHLAFDPAVYLRQPSAWATLLLVTGAFTFIVLRSTWLYNRAVVRLLAQVSEQRDQIESISLHDRLTGLPIAQLGEDRAAMAIAAARRTSDKVAFLFIDLDDFKAVNDTHGHEAGNAVLREVAHRIRDSLRAADTVARLGGDELLAIIGELANAEDAGLVASKIIQAVSLPIPYKGQRISVGTSIGIAIFPDDSEDPRELRHLADVAMYAAKSAGKNRHAFASGLAVKASASAAT